MRWISARNLRLPAIVAAAMAWGTTALAHEKWFHDDPAKYPSLLDQVTQPMTLGFIGAVVVTVGVLGLVWRAVREKEVLPGPADFGADEEGRSLLYGLVPAILGLHVAIPLLVNALHGELFSPNNPLVGVWKYWLGLVQVGAALSFFYGGLTRPAAALLALTWLIGCGAVGLEPMLENIHYLGFAAFFWLAGRGPFSIDRLLMPKFAPSDASMRLAMPALRTGVALSLIAVAFSEKLANRPLALSFLKTYDLNFTGYLGIPMSDEVFVLCAGSVELLVGLCLLFGIFTRLIILIAWLPFNLTLTVFNWVELAGHLPYYGALAVLMVWTASEEEQRLFIRGLKLKPRPALP
jgi:uncharacterized membrane protein YphA (DoxX/SURF4 family)